MFDIYCMQMGGETTLPAHTQYTRYNNTHLATIKRIVERARTEYVWVVSDLCDYSNFDFTWQPVPWEAEQIHCWASGDQKFGDTFLIPVKEFKRQVEVGLPVLGWYEHINWHADGVPRTTLGNMYDWYHYSDARFEFYPNLWEKRVLHSFGTNGSVLLVPRDCKSHFSTQYYDYPYILCHTDWKVDEKAQDVVFISYDEKNADLNYNILKKRTPRAKRLHGVEGMENALYQAALLSETDWFFAVFAKTRLHEDFDFSYLPDRLQGDKHYIFNCKNLVNGLEYGHMGVILYHRQMVIDSHDYEKLGLDYTMSHRHDIVPVTSCYGVFNTSPFETWRAAFRETIKLAQQLDETPSIETQYRLKIWCEYAGGDYADYCTTGAQHGVEFYNLHKDNMQELKKTFRWDWLQDYFNSKFT
jgi:hypothetical protein